MKVHIYFRSGRWTAGPFSGIPKREALWAVVWCAKRNYELHGLVVDLEIQRLLEKEGCDDV